MFSQEFDPVPWDEECPDLLSDQRLAAQKLVAGIKRKFANQEGLSSCSFKIKSCPHDFGNYISIEVGCDENDAAGVDFICYLDNNFPATWADI